MQLKYYILKAWMNLVGGGGGVILDFGSIVSKKYIIYLVLIYSLHK